MSPDPETKMADNPSTINHQQPCQPNQPTRFWVQETNLSTIADLINEQLQQDAKEQPNEGAPDKHLGEEFTPQQHLRLNLIRHRGAVSSLKTIDLFKGFISALKAVDPLLVVLQIAASKQHNTPLSSIKQVQSMEGNKLMQFFSHTIKNKCSP